MCDLIKTNIGEKQCLSRLLTCGRYLQTSLFWGCLLEIDGFILLARMRASDSSRMNWSKDLSFFCGFPFWRKWRDSIGSKHWFLPYQWYARISFATSALFYLVFDSMIATCLSGWHLSWFCCIVEQFEVMECFFSPFPFHTISPTAPLAQLQQSLIRD